MNKSLRSAFLFILFLSVFVSGCATCDQLFVGPNGDVQKCGSFGYGIIGSAMAENIYEDCAESFHSAGYLEIEKAGVIGIVISEDTVLTILKVYPGSPAAEAGILAGDVLLKVDGISVHSKNDASILLFGLAGTQVRLEVLADNEAQSISLVRESYPKIYGHKAKRTDKPENYDSWNRSF